MIYWAMYNTESDTFYQRIQKIGGIFLSEFDDESDPLLHLGSVFRSADDLMEDVMRVEEHDGVPCRLVSVWASEPSTVMVPTKIVDNDRVINWAGMMTPNEFIDTYHDE